MRFLVDQDVYRLTIDKLKEWGHDVVTLKEFGSSRASDEDLLKIGKDQNRILITRDKDFGGLLFLKEKESKGVIFLRIGPKSLEEVHRELWRTLEEHSEEELNRCFCVIEPGRHRIRHLAIRD